MVSIHSGGNVMGSSAARFLSEDDDVPILEVNDDSKFRPMKTHTVFSVHLFISACISLIGVILAAVWKDEKRCEAYFIMLYLRAVFWVITLIFDHIVKHHHEQLRVNGYHDFYRSTSVHKGIPFLIVSLWNTALLALQSFMQHYYGPNFAEHCIQSIFSPIIYVTTFTVVETALLCLVNGSYIAKVSRFNKSSPVPDALRGSHPESGSVGLMQPGANMTELFEKQADLITYLKEHNNKLNQKLMQLNAQVLSVTMSQHQ